MYHRKQLEDGRWTTRCQACMSALTEGVEVEDMLARMEANHLCPERAMQELLAEKEAASKGESNERVN